MCWMELLCVRERVACEEGEVDAEAVRSALRSTLPMLTCW